MKPVSILRTVCLILVVVLGTIASFGPAERSKVEDDIFKRLAGLEEEIADLKSQLKEVKTAKCKRQMQLPEEVGFTARLSTHLKSLGKDRPIRFNYVVSNIGSAYDNITGVFIAPVPGTYMFYTTIMSEYNNEFIETEIVKNGAQLVELYSGAPSGFDSSGNMVIVPLNKGDHVWVKVHGANSNTFSIHGGFSTFSGFLLRLDEAALQTPVVG